MFGRATITLGIGPHSSSVNFHSVWQCERALGERHVAVAWCNGNDDRSINDVTLRRVRLVPGWLTVFGRAKHLGMKPPSQAARPTQPPTLRRTGNEYRPKYGDALQLGSKGRMAHSVWVAGKTV